MTLFAIKSFQAIKKKVAKCLPIRACIWKLKSFIKNYTRKIPKRFLFFKKRKISKIFGKFWRYDLQRSAKSSWWVFASRVPSAAKFDIFDVSVCRVNCFEILRWIIFLKFRCANASNDRAYLIKFAKRLYAGLVVRTVKTAN